MLFREHAEWEPAALDCIQHLLRYGFVEGVFSHAEQRAIGAKVWSSAAAAGIPLEQVYMAGHDVAFAHFVATC